ncbi:hypothetical protein PVAP13_2NG578000 [Panicum virgatum]|uniref:NAD-dependent epimerase/dehydratase domain-containing protein n=1 Tax=Panicum virgatum TaxID=38727 RepID=A0A8T0VTQ3_PANVG|nr:hypothetical protein PVAP13_2NG578000 [Panicum virgatum]
MQEEGAEKKMRSTVVCVTGGAGYIGSWLVRKLLGRGCVVHATLTNLEDDKKAGLLRALPGAAERLRLFQADMYDADTFEPAIAGCEFVFLVATPLVHDPTSTKYKNTTEATVDAARIILRQCERSGTVRRVIYTASVTAASPLREGGGGYKDFINESCWTPHAARPPLRVQQRPPGRIRVVQDAVGEGAAALQRRRVLPPGVRGGLAGVRARRRRHHPAAPLEQHPGDGGAADGPRRPPQLPALHAGAAGLRAAGAHGGRLRGARLLHGLAGHGRPLPLRRRVPQHARHPRPLRRQVPRHQDTAPTVRRDMIIYPFRLFLILASLVDLSA